MSRFGMGPRLQAGVVLGLVAAVGALLGILGDRLVAQQREGTVVEMPARPMGPGMGAGPRYGERLALQLDLTAEQRAQIDTILAEQQLRIRELSREFQPRFRAVAAQTRERVEAVLTPEQRDRLREMRAERIRGLGPERPMFRDGPRQGPGPRPRP